MAFSKMSSLGGGGDHFDPDQPRVPAGHPNGGQWSKLGALLSGKFDDPEEAAFGPKPGSSRIPDDATQLAFLDTNMPARMLARPRRLFPPVRLQPDNAATLFDLWSAQNGPDGYAVLQLHRTDRTFRAFGFTRAPAEVFVFSHATVKRLSKDEVRKECEAFDLVQSELDKTYDEVLDSNPGADRGQLGTALHVAMENKINGKGSSDIRAAAITLKLRAEPNYLPGEEEPKGKINYGKPGTLRPDLREISVGAALEKLTPRTVCIYEYTIGKRGMLADRPIALGEITKKAFAGHNFMNFIVIQMRPRNYRLGGR